MKKRWKISDVCLERDFDEILEIEKVFGESGWNRRMFIQKVKKPAVPLFSVVKSGHNNRIEGYCSALLVMEELEIHRIAVRESTRRQGVGSILLLDVLRRAVKGGAFKAFLDVRDSNVEAQCFYQKFGFVRTGLRSNYYSNPREDALVLGRPIKMLKAGNACDTVKS